MKFLEATISKWAQKYKYDWIHSYQDTQDVLVEEKLQKGSEVTSQILIEGKLSSNWRYDHQGFRPISAFKWKKLEPTDKRVATERHSLEIVSRERGSIGQGRHCFLRLVNDQGDVHSVGFCGAIWFPLSWQRGVLISPDPQEVYGKGERFTHIKLDPAKYAEIFTCIETDKQAGKEAFSSAASQLLGIYS